MVMRLPERDQLSVTRGKMKADLAVAMGGRIAEELIFGHEKVTSGASSDIQMATNMAKAMVTQYGMSEDMGPLAYGENEQEVFWAIRLRASKTCRKKLSAKSTLKCGAWWKKAMNRPKPSAGKNG